MDKAKTPAGKNQPAAKTSGATPVVRATPLPPGPVPPLFRKIDWLTFGLTLALVFIGYLLTISPDLTLEDSGELATGSFYAGVPHPPGYPVWTLYTWLFTKIIPFSNIAFRVSIGCAFSGALACGLIALAVSRGSSMMIEGIASLKNIDRRWENALCVVSGLVAGMLIGFNGYMWSQAIIVEVYPFSVVSLMGVMLCLLRWIYAPHQWRYLFWAMFLFGICFTNHQTLIVAAMGIEIAIIAAHPKLGRDVLIGNSIFYIAGLILDSKDLIPTFARAPGQTNMVFVIFSIVGVSSLIGFLVLWFLKPKKQLEIARDACLAGVLLLPAFGIANPTYMSAMIGLAVLLFIAFVVMAWQTRKTAPEMVVAIICGLLWIAGAAFYFYMPLAGMTDPPMQWGYPRTVEGFFHALSRGQYEKTNPTNFLNDPGRLVTQLVMLFQGVVNEFNWIYALIALVPFVFFLRMQKRERAWLIGIAATYFCLGVLLLILLNPPPDRQAKELIRVFFTASHVMVALCVGYGLTLIGAFMATQYERFRQIGLFGAAIAAAFALYSLGVTIEDFFGHRTDMNVVQLFFYAIGRSFAKGQYGLPVIAGLLLLAAMLVFILVLVFSKTKARLGIILVIFLVGPAYSIMTHWFDNEQRHHYFGYWFGHDMFTPPFVAPDGKLSYDLRIREQLMKDPEKAKLIYLEMDRDTVLFGGTDPGRFCPTYMIFCESFIPPSCKPRDPNFDRRDVYIITQNALADGTYLQYIRAHYNRSTEIDVPFFQEFVRSAKERKLNYETNALARLAGKLLDTPFEKLGDNIEKQRRVGASYFKESDFLDLKSLAAKLQKGNPQDPVSKFIYDNLSKETQDLLVKSADSKLAKALAKDLNQIIEREVAPRRAHQEDKVLELSFYNAERFKGIQLPEKLQRFIAQDPQSHTRVRLNRQLLETVYSKEIAVSPGGVYPDLEIFTPTPEESQQCFNEYLAEAQKRLSHDMNFPNEPKQIRPGEDVRIVNVNGEQRVTVSGQIAVMAINGLLTKVIFDKNPKHEFYVEESFPLDWMYPYLTPYGIIMKINREKLPELSDDIIKRDHEFWSRYTERLIGTNVVNYDTPVADIAKFCEKIYLERNFSGFKGDRKFARDDQAQKAFSKLRSSIGGIYSYRIGASRPGSPEQQKMIKEADFAFRQAFAFCPYSPEAVFRYAQLLISLSRIDDALLVATTCLKLDPYNGSVIDLVKNLRSAQAQQSAMGQQASAQRNALAQLENEYRINSTNFQAAFNLASAYLQMGQTNRVIHIFDQVLANPKVDEKAIVFIAQAYVNFQNFPKLEATLERRVQITPDSPEAWYDLAAMKAALVERGEKNKTPDAIKALQRSVDLSDQRLATNATAANLHTLATGDARFNSLKQNPEFQKLVGGK